MQLFTTIFPLIVLTFVLGNACTLSNKIDLSILECGLEAQNHRGKTIKLLAPDGSPILNSHDFIVEPLNGDSTQPNIELTSKACLLVPEETGVQTTFVIRSNREGLNWGQVVKSNEVGKSINLRDSSRDDLKFPCDKTLFTNGSVRLPRSQTGELNSFLLDADLSSDTPLNIWKNFHTSYNTLPAIEFPKELPDGDYKINLSVRNIFAKDKSIVHFECPVRFDRTSPKVTFKINGKNESIENATFAPGQTLTFQLDDKSESQLFYCIGAKGSNTCSEAENFTESGSKEMTFIPSSGLWEIFYETKDNAGNISEKQILPFRVIDQSKIENIVSKLIEANTFLESAPTVALAKSLKALEYFYDLTFEDERAIIYDEVLILLNQLGNDIRQRAAIEHFEAHTFENESGFYAIVAEDSGRLSLINDSGKKLFDFELETNHRLFSVSPRGSWLVDSGKYGTCNFYKIDGNKIHAKASFSNLRDCTFEWKADESSFHLWGQMAEYSIDSDGLHTKVVEPYPEVEFKRVVTSDDGKFYAGLTVDNELIFAESLESNIKILRRTFVEGVIDFTFGKGTTNNHNLYLTNVKSEIWTTNSSSELTKLEIFRAHSKAISPELLLNFNQVKYSKIKASTNGDLWIRTEVGFFQILFRERPIGCFHEPHNKFKHNFNGNFDIFANGRALAVDGGLGNPSYVQAVPHECSVYPTDSPGLSVDRGRSDSHFYTSPTRSKFFTSQEKLFSLWDLETALPTFYGSAGSALLPWQAISQTLLISHSTANFEIYNQGGRSILRLSQIAPEFAILDAVGIPDNGSLQIYSSSGVKTAETTSLIADDQFDRSKVIKSGFDPLTRKYFVVTDKKWLTYHIGENSITPISNQEHGYILEGIYSNYSTTIQGNLVIDFADNNSVRHLVDIEGHPVRNDINKIFETDGNLIFNNTNKLPGFFPPFQTLNWQLIDSTTLEPLSIEGKSESNFVKMDESGKTLLAGLADGKFLLWDRMDDGTFKMKNLSGEWTFNQYTFSDSSFHFNHDGKYLFVSDEESTNVFSNGKHVPISWKVNVNFGTNWTHSQLGPIVTLQGYSSKNFLTKIDGLKIALCTYYEVQKELNNAGFTHETNEGPAKLCSSSN